MENHNQLLGLAGGPTLKLEPDSPSVRIKSDLDRKMGQILVAATEAQREAKRAFYGKRPSLLSEDFDAVDHMYWDQFLTSPDIVLTCENMAGVSPEAILTFALENCSPSNPDALFWMRAWFKQMYADTNLTGEQVAAVVDEAKKLFENSQANARREKAVKAADVRHSQPGGTRDMQEAIRKEWASGKYQTRRDCAEDCWERVGFNNYETARNALKGTPEPVIRAPNLTRRA